jgi:hypothetical protein
LKVYWRLRVTRTNSPYSSSSISMTSLKGMRFSRPIGRCGHARVVVASCHPHAHAARACGHVRVLRAARQVCSRAQARTTHLIGCDLLIAERRDLGADEARLPQHHLPASKLQIALLRIACAVVRVVRRRAREGSAEHGIAHRKFLQHAARLLDERLEIIKRHLRISSWDRHREPSRGCCRF